MKVVDSGGGQPEFAQVTVSLGDLADFAQTLRIENQANLEPHAARIIASHMQGPLFGERSLSREMLVARSLYAEFLLQAVREIDTLTTESRFLVDAIEDVARRYSGADLLAAERSNNVAALLNDRWPQPAEQDSATRGQEAARDPRPLRRPE